MISRQILTIILTFAGIIFGAALAYAFATREKESIPTQEKRKRAPYADVYALIDRLVDELDTDEMAYLRRRLEEHEDTAPADAAQTLEMLLDERQQRLSSQ